MSGFTTAFPTSLKGELARAKHDFSTGGHIFKCALGKGSVSGTYGPATTNYSDMAGAGDEVSGPGYVVGGFAWTAAQNITPQVNVPSSKAYWSWSVNPQWGGATFDISGCVIYNTNFGNAAVYVGSFGGARTVASATLTLILPSNGPTTSILGLD